MGKLISIDPGKFKCGLVLAEINKKKVYEAIIIKSELVEDYLKNLNNNLNNEFLYLFPEIHFPP